MLAGTTITLRPLCDGDRDARHALGRDPEFVRMNGGDPHRATTFTHADADRWYRGFPQSLRWVIEQDGRMLGETRLDLVDAADRRARFAIGIFTPSGRDRGIGTEATRLVLDYAFGPLHLAEVMLRVLSINARAIRCYEKCGFVIYAVEREHAYVDGRWQDDLLMRVDADVHRARRAVERGDAP